MLGKILPIAIIVCLIAIAMTLAVQTLTRKRKLNEGKKFTKYNRRFRFYNDFYLTRKSFRRIHAQVASLGAYTFIEARVVTVQFVERSAIVSILLFVVGAIGLGDILSGTILFMFSIILFNRSVMKKIDKVNFASTKAVGEFISSLIDTYTRVGNIPDALRDCKCPAIIASQRESLYRIVTATNGKKLLDDFHEECPHKVLKTLAIACYLINDNGDSTGDSPFKRALRLVKAEVSMSVKFLTAQSILFKSLERLPIFPLFAYPVIMAIFIKLIPATASVYESNIGYVIKVIILGMSFASYYILTTMNNPTVATADDRIYFLKEALLNSKFEKWAKTLTTKSHRRRFYYKNKMRGCLSSKDIVYLYLEKYYFATILTVFSIIASLFIIVAGRTAIHDSISTLSMTSVTKYTAEQEVAVHEIDDALLLLDELPDDDALAEMYGDALAPTTSLQVDNQLERIKMKYSQYTNLTYKWWFSLIYIAAALMGFFVPDYLISLRVKMVQAEAEVDVLQMQTVLAILMDTNLDTLQTLYWLQKTSDIHKDVLLYCYHEYTRNAHMAIARMRDHSSIPEFRSICEKLLTTIDQITVREAFEDLVADRDNMLEIREMLRMDALQARRRQASPIALAPAWTVIILCFIMPIVIVAIRSAIATLGNLNL